MESWWGHLVGFFGHFVAMELRLECVIEVFVSVGRYQHRVEWARDFMRRQGHDESTVQKILTDYTEPLELPCRKEKEETAQHGPLSSQADSSQEGRAGKDELSVTPGGAGQSDDLQGLNTHSDCLQEGPGHATLAVASPSSLNGHVVEDPEVLPQTACCSQEALIPQDGLWPEASSQAAGEKRAAHEYVLIEEEPCDVQEEQAAPDEKVRSSKCPAQLFWASVTVSDSQSSAVGLGFLKSPHSLLLSLQCWDPSPVLVTVANLSLMQTVP